MSFTQFRNHYLMSDCLKAIDSKLTWCFHCIKNKIDWKGQNHLELNNWSDWKLHSLFTFSKNCDNKTRKLWFWSASNYNLPLSSIQAINFWRIQISSKRSFFDANTTQIYFSKQNCSHNVWSLQLCKRYWIPGFWWKKFHNYKRGKYVSPSTWRRNWTACRPV